MLIILINLMLHFASLFCADDCDQSELHAFSGLVSHSAVTSLFESLGHHFTLRLVHYSHCSVWVNVSVRRSVGVSVKIFDNPVRCVILCVLLRVRVHC